AVTGERATTPEALEADTAAQAKGRSRPRTPRGAKQAAGEKTGNGRVMVGGMTITHPERVIFTNPDFSKRALIEYYDSVAELMLPHLLKRRVALLRCPQGTSATCFFQKHLRSEAPPGVQLD